MKKILAKPTAAILLTGIAALCLSALPMLLLWMHDALLFAAPHTRTYESAAPVLSGDDLYLVRALKNQQALQAEAAYYYDVANTEKNFYVSKKFDVQNMERLWDEQGTRFFQKQLAALIEKKILPPAFAKQLQSDLEVKENLFYYTSDSAGFLYFYAYNSQKQVENYDPFCQFTLESRTGKMLALRAQVAQQAAEQGFDTLGAMQSYVDYLELGALDDWASPEKTGFAQRALYSKTAQLLAYCTQRGGSQADMQEYRCDLVPFDEKQLQRWESYTESAN